MAASSMQHLKSSIQSVLDAPSSISTISLDARNVAQWAPLTPSISEEPATSPPLSHVKIVIEPLHTWEHWFQSGTKHLRPAALEIENTVSRPISVRQYVQAVHEYTVPLRRLLFRCCDICGGRRMRWGRGFGMSVRWAGVGVERRMCVRCLWCF
ncbi:hypothetical protein HBI73_146430 [Parastagonospora nodorum]|nr:hypothetical protein HBI10_064650 [Parastagonospora nodorum]KAH4132732.1 hypothetical protein HBH47_001090 [Parastagonospora nodorum]KAH4226925.1 hypothetical protein HBI06_103450 [Parastagonospora nodorum]KAH4797798.1 hypothetical protein HBH63_069660 [Parastagonospora nodorum]KAH5087449.1 hypothetical protein HBI73_146430 [Parastagonospora nodorum]